MLIAGGCYRESCESPHWRALYGSGGRAASAVARLSPQVELYTYRPQGLRSDLKPFEALGVRIRATSSPTEIAFAYFHPLSKPSIAPQVSEIVSQAPLRIEGNTVLRFGLLEGDAIVTADRAIYDPQTEAGVRTFGENGSRANSLAIVLNERELCAMTDMSDLDSAAHQVMARDNAAVLIAKAGIRGATIYEPGGETTWIPAYESPAVFKIGSGDVFSAAFAHYWGEARLAPAVAGDLASRSVSYFCGTRKLPLPIADQLTTLRPIGSARLQPVLLSGSVATIGGRWVMEEAQWCLNSLGADVVAPSLDSADFNCAASGNWGAMLAMADYLDETVLESVIRDAKGGRPVVILSQGERSLPDLVGCHNVRFTDDFVTSIYLVGWAAAI